MSGRVVEPCMFLASTHGNDSGIVYVVLTAPRATITRSAPPSFSGHSSVHSRRSVYFLSLSRSLSPATEVSVFLFSYYTNRLLILFTVLDVSVFLGLAVHQGYL